MTNEMLLKCVTSQVKAKQAEGPYYMPGCGLVNKNNSFL